MADVKDLLQDEQRLHAGEVRRRAVSGVLAYGVRTVVLRLIAFAGTLVLARYLAPHDFGLISIGLSIMIAGRFLSDAGLGAALVRQADTPERRQLEWLQGFQLVVTASFVTLLAVIAAPLGRGGEVATIMAAALLIETFRIPAVLTAQRRLEWSPLIRAEIADTVVFYMWAITAVALGYGVVAVALGAIVRSIVNTAIVVALTRVIVRPRFSLRGVRSLLGFGAAFQATQFLSIARDQGVILLTGAIAGAAALGLWSLAYRLLTPMWMLFQTVWRVSYPAMSRLMATGEDPAPILRRALGLMAVTTGAVLVPLVAAMPALIPTLFGEEWSGVVWIVPPAALAMLIVGPVSTCLTGYLYAVGRPGVMVRSLLLDTSVWFTVTLPLLPVFGIQMVGWGMLAGFTVEALVLYRAGRRDVDLDARRTLLLPTVISLPAAAGGWALAESLPHDAVSMLLAAGAAEAAYLAVCLMLTRSLVLDLVAVLRRGMARALPARRAVPVAQT